jgi:hypothetical protein
MKTIVAVLSLVACSYSFAGDWGSTNRLATGLSVVSIVMPTGKLQLAWKPQIIPGDDLLLLTMKIGAETFYRRYIFLGVRGGSLQLTLSALSRDLGIVPQRPFSSNPRQMGPTILSLTICEMKAW